jgi:hypothetical protein
LLSTNAARVIFSQECARLKQDCGDGIVACFNRNGLCYEQEELSRSCLGMTIYEHWSLGYSPPFVQPFHVAGIMYGITQLLSRTQQTVSLPIALSPGDHVFENFPTMLHMRVVRNTPENGGTFLACNFRPNGGLQAWYARRSEALDKPR